MRPWLLFALLLPLGACDDGDGDRAARPDAVPLTAEATSHFCGMTVTNHPGPKAQVHVAGLPEPLFFSSVRDGIAFLKSPEKLGAIAAAYVTDMGAAESWAAPGRDNWISAGDAHFVVGSRRRGGMGAPAIVPFATSADAAAFAAEQGGEVMTLDAIPEAAALGAVDLVFEERQP